MSITAAWFHRRRFWVLNWSAWSQDISPIADIWLIIKHKIQQRTLRTVEQPELRIYSVNVHYIFKMIVNWVKIKTEVLQAIVWPGSYNNTFWARSTWPGSSFVHASTANKSSQWRKPVETRALQDWKKTHSPTRNHVSIPDWYSIFEFCVSVSHIEPKNRDFQYLNGKLNLLALSLTGTS